jgi:hypothetical protein
MRRIVTTALALALGGAALSAPAVAADQGRPAATTAAQQQTKALEEAADKALEPGLALPASATAEVAQVSAPEALATARRVLSGQSLPSDPSATLALRDLFMKRSDLRGRDLRNADRLLARPSDGAGDNQGFGYTAPEAPPVCNTRLCVHYVPTGADAPPSPEWPAHNLAVMDSVWSTIVDSLGYRAPLPDRSAGGNALFDVYLKDLGDGLYGFCAPERRVKNRTASGYCVLDNDYAAAQFPVGTPDDNLVVTAGHEFFHAVQFAYDYGEDLWMMESTATWMEERIATQVNDNRQYFSTSQIYAPYVPLDTFSRTATFQYGNWVFWEYLTNRYGIGLVNKAWKQAGSLRKDGGKSSIPALQKILKRKGGLTKVYAQFAAGNLLPAVNYPEGAEYPSPKVKGAKKLSRGKRAKRFATKINHLASASYVYVPGKGLGAKKWKLSLAVTAPVKRTSPAAVVVTYFTNGKRKATLVKLGPGGDGRTRVSFDNRKVGAVSVTLVNASTRYRCGSKTLLASEGVPLDDRARFAVAGRVTKG